MFLKLILSPDRLAALHKVLGESWNTWSYESTSGETGDKPFVWIKNSKANGGQNNPTPNYDITLVVEENYQHPASKVEMVSTPLSVLTRIHNTIGLFPNDLHRVPKIIDDIHFVYVPEYPGSRIRAHWRAINARYYHVAVFEPVQEDLAWHTSRWAPGDNPAKDAAEERGSGKNEEYAFSLAVQWASKTNGNYPDDSKTAPIEVAGIRFAWVEKHKEIPGHWRAQNSKVFNVAVFEPGTIDNNSRWTVINWAFSERLKNAVKNWDRRVNPANEERAFETAAHWANDVDDDDTVVNDDKPDA